MKQQCLQGSVGAACLSGRKFYFMPNTYSQIYLQFVFAVQHRQALIPKEHKEELHKYITGIVQKRKSKMIAIHCMPDHAHIFIGFKPIMEISDLVKEIKVASNGFINDNKWVNRKFNWQEGYGVFSYSHSHIDQVAKYVLNQEAHHKKKTFRREYLEFIEKFAIPYEEKYLFDFMD
jgi:putative transposase